jgi:hypothetical protein
MPELGRRILAMVRNEGRIHAEAHTIKVESLDGAAGSGLRSGANELIINSLTASLVSVRFWPYRQLGFSVPRLPCERYGCS